MLTAHLRPDATAAAETLQALRSRLDHELAEVRRPRDRAVCSRVTPLLQVILWRIGSLRHMFSSTHCRALDSHVPLPPAVTAPDFFTVAVAALQLVREVRPHSGTFDEVISGSPDHSVFLMQHALYAPPTHPSHPPRAPNA